MAKRIVYLLGTLIISIFLTNQAYSQCDAWLQITYGPAIDRDGTDSIAFIVPMYMENTCPVGAIDFYIVTDPSDVVIPIGFDTTGSRFSYWPYFNFVPHGIKARIWGIFSFPGTPDVPPLDTGVGLVCNVIFGWGCNYESNINVSLGLETVFIFDSTGYINYPTNIYSGIFYVLDEVTGGVRGDANCSGDLLGSDVTCLVGYFRGTIKCPCSLCRGDANYDFGILGSDVTFLVRYFRGLGPPPDPFYCDE